MSEIIGIVVLFHSNQIEGHENETKRCICCPDFPSHIYGMKLELPEYDTSFTSDRRIDRWLESVFDFKKLEGRKIKITAELAD